jgi:hypothetical protein
VSVGSGRPLEPGGGHKCGTLSSEERVRRIQVKGKNSRFVVVIATMAGAIMSCAEPAFNRTSTRISRKDAIPTHSAPKLLGVWVAGLDITYARENEVIGIIFETQAPPEGEVVAHAVLLEQLASATIRCAFRSAREAHLIAARYAADGPVQWIRAEFAGKWSFEPADPPRTDHLPAAWLQKSSDLPVGDLDVGLIHSPRVTLLPPPLQERGVAVALSRPKANSFVFMVPQDQTASIFTSWSDMERRVGAATVDLWG